MKLTLFVKQFLLFALSGSVAVSLDYTLYITTFKMLGPIYAKLIGFYSGVIVSFLFNSIITFKQKNKLQLCLKKFLNYIIILTVSMILNITTNYVILTFVNDIQYKFYMAFIFATFLSMSFNFILLKFWIFK